MPFFFPLLLVIEEGEKIKYVTDFYFIDCWFVSETFVMFNPSGIQQVCSIGNSLHRHLSTCLLCLQALELK